MLAVVEYPNTVLAQKCQDVLSFDDELRSLVAQMVDTMYASNGIGIAAPQVGSNLRILLIDPSGGEVANQMIPMINPRVTWRSLQTEASDEGCLSMPGKVFSIVRSLAVEVEYHDVNGLSHKLQCTGLTARIVQHEVDHLDGIMMIDRVSAKVRKLALKSIGKIR